MIGRRYLPGVGAGGLLGGLWWRVLAVSGADGWWGGVEWRR